MVGPPGPAPGVWPIAEGTGLTRLRKLLNFKKMDLFFIGR